MPQNPEISIVLPVYNEQENLPRLLEEITAAALGFGRACEVLFIDDGSTDQSLEVIKNLARKDAQVRWLAFAANQGQSAAFCAGFDAARAPILITMDADLQNDPADIPAMLRLFEQGYDMVIGWRAKRRDSWIKRLASRVGNAVRNRLTGESVRDTGCSLKIMRADMARGLPRFKGLHRFLPTLMKMHGARLAEIQVNHRPREHGASKYGTWDRAWATMHDLMGVRWLQSRSFRCRIRESNLQERDR